MRGRATTPILFVVLLGFAGGIAAVRARSTGQSPAHDQPASEEERAWLLAKGKEVFVERCARCHNECGEKPLKTGPFSILTAPGSAAPTKTPTCCYGNTSPKEQT
jgi:mono/diheme cytochrome c family protein